MLAVIFMAINNYTDSTSIMVNSVHVISVTPTEAQWEMKHKVC